MVNLIMQSLTPHIGAEVQGIDLAESLDDEAFEEILQALYAKAVLVFRGQRIDPRQQIEFSRRFGTPQTYAMDHYSVPGCPEVTVVSNIVENGRQIGLYSDEVEWHVDLALTPHPSSFTFLYCTEAAATGGDTLFAAADAAYEALPAVVQKRLRGLQAVHSADYYREQRAQHGQGEPQAVSGLIQTWLIRSFGHILSLDEALCFSAQ
jgi:taurine dioxygenase